MRQSGSTASVILPQIAAAQARDAETRARIDQGGRFYRGTASDQLELRAWRRGWWRAPTLGGRFPAQARAARAVSSPEAP